MPEKTLLRGVVLNLVARGGAVHEANQDSDKSAGTPIWTRKARP